MSQSEDIARAFMVLWMGDPDAWTTLGDPHRDAITKTFSVLLSERVIAVPERERKRVEFPIPAAVRSDCKDIRAYADGLETLYARAHEDVLGPSGGGEVAGRGSLVDVDPTGEAAVDRRRAARRGDVRRAGQQILTARNALRTARDSLEEIAPREGFRQPERVATDASVTQAQLDEARRKQASG